MDVDVDVLDKRKGSWIEEELLHGLVNSVLPHTPLSLTHACMLTRTVKRQLSEVQLIGTARYERRMGLSGELCSSMTFWSGASD